MEVDRSSVLTPVCFTQEQVNIYIYIYMLLTDVDTLLHLLDGGICLSKMI